MIMIMLITAIMVVIGDYGFDVVMGMVVAIGMAKMSSSKSERAQADTQRTS